MSDQGLGGGAGKPQSATLEAQRQEWLTHLAAQSDDEAQLALDDLVVDLCANSILDALNSTDGSDGQEGVISSAEKKASEINNSGPAGQIDFILKECGEGEGSKILAELFSIEPSGPRPYE